VPSLSVKLSDDVGCGGQRNGNRREEKSSQMIQKQGARHLWHCAEALAHSRCWRSAVAVGAAGAFDLLPSSAGFTGCGVGFSAA